MSNSINFQEERKGNVLLAIPVAIILSVVLAFAWAGLTVLTERWFAIVAIGIGMLIGAGVDWSAKKCNKVVNGILAAVFALACILAGNVLSHVWLFAKEYDTSLFEILNLLTMTDIVDLLKETFEIIDIVFYGAAAYIAFRVCLGETKKKGDLSNSAIDPETTFKQSMDDTQHIG